MVSKLTRRWAYLPVLLCTVGLGVAAHLPVPAAYSTTQTDLRVLLVASHMGGLDHWNTRESFMVENLLDFNRIPYDYFDIGADSLDQSTLDQYDGVILEVHAVRLYGDQAEQDLLAQNMNDGSICVLLGPIRGNYTGLNPTVYDAIDVSVDGLGNEEGNITLLEGATMIFDYWAEDGFLVVGGHEGKHVGVTVSSLGDWARGHTEYGEHRTFGIELALSIWMNNAFGVDARVTLPVISVRLDDTQTTTSEQHQEVVDFIEANSHRIRASGFLVTSVSAYMGTDSTLQNYEQIISRWGSMSLHGYDHGSVGAEGENRDYERQYNDMNAAVSLLQEHFSRYKAMKASPNNSWNEATLHAMYDNGIYYHTACLWTSDAYKALYKSLFDVDSELEREKMYARGVCGLLRYYPLVHSDETGEVRIYSVDWGPVVSAGHTPYGAIDVLREYGLDWWTPLLIGAHYSIPGPHGANGNPEGWMTMMGTLMDSVDCDTYCWRRWVDSYDFAVNVERFDKGLTVNDISVAGDVITYDITADQAIRFMSLKAERTGYKVKSVVIDGTEHCYFGDNYVHLPEIEGNMIVEVTVMSQEDGRPHVTHIDPSGVIEAAGCVNGKLALELSGEFEVTARISCSDKAFMQGTTRVFDDGTEHLGIDVSSNSEAGQIGMSLAPSSGWVEVTVDTWEVAETYYKRWNEAADSTGTSVEHNVGDLIPNSYYVIRLDGNTIDSCMTSSTGELSFTYSPGCSVRTFEVIEDSSAVAALRDGGSPWDAQGAEGLSLRSHPNPCTSTATVSYHLLRSCPVSLRVYSVGGRLICRLVDDVQPAGAHSVVWMGLSESGHRVSPGIYFFRLDTASSSDTHTIVVIK